MPLLPGSPAIGGGNVALVPTGISTDQRGNPRLLNGKVDIGAFESQGFTLTVTTGSTPQSAASEWPSPTRSASRLQPKTPSNQSTAELSVSSLFRRLTAPRPFSQHPRAVITAGQASITAAPDNVLTANTSQCGCFRGVGFIRPHQHRHAFRQSDREYHDRCPRPRGGCPESARSHRVRQFRYHRKCENHFRPHDLRDRPNNHLSLVARSEQSKTRPRRSQAQLRA